MTDLESVLSEKQLNHLRQEKEIKKARLLVLGGFLAGEIIGYFISRYCGCCNQDKLVHTTFSGFAGFYTGLTASFFY